MYKNGFVLGSCLKMGSCGFVFLISLRCWFYWRIGRSDWIRTSDRTAPSRVRYQTAPRSDKHISNVMHQTVKLQVLCFCSKRTVKRLYSSVFFHQWGFIVMTLLPATHMIIIFLWGRRSTASKNGSALCVSTKTYTLLIGSRRRIDILASSGNLPRRLKSFGSKFVQMILTQRCATALLD